MVKVVSVRIEENTAEEYARVYGKTYTGMQIAAESFLSLRKRTFETLKGVFTKEELTALVDSFNGSMRQEKYLNKSVLVVQVEDSEKFDNIANRHNLDYSSFISKIKGLTECQAYFLMDRIFLFMDNNTDNVQLFLNDFNF